MDALDLSSMVTIPVDQDIVPELLQSSHSMSACTTSILAYESFLEYFDLDATTIGAFGAAYVRLMSMTDT